LWGDKNKFVAVFQTDWLVRSDLTKVENELIVSETFGKESLSLIGGKVVDCCHELYSSI